MSVGDTSLAGLIRQIVRDEFVENYGVPCTVKDIDTETLTCTCSPVNGDADFIDIRLQADPGNGMIIIPTIGSIVIVQPINNMTGYIGMFSKVDSIQFLDGSFGGLIKIQDLVTKLNNLEDKVNELIQALKVHTHIGVTTGAGVSGSSTAFASTQEVTKTVKEDIENPLITHGEL